MESQYLTEVSEYGLSYHGREQGKEHAAAKRIQNRIKTGVTMVIVRVANPRYNVK